MCIHTRLRPGGGCRLFQLYLTTQQTRSSHIYIHIYMFTYNRSIYTYINICAEQLDENFHTARSGSCGINEGKTPALMRACTHACTITRRV